MARLTMILTVLTTLIGLLGGFRWLAGEVRDWRARRGRWLTVALIVACAGPITTVQAQTYETMKMVRPVATGTAGTGLDSNNRIYRAYQGIEYNIHADAVGGHWPYTYSLSGTVPSGMSIEAGPCTDIGPDNCTAGTITWTPGSSGTFGPITVRATDVDGNYVEGTWSIVVSTTIGADGFCFLDAVSGNDTTGTGSHAAPYASIAKAYASCGARSIIYFKTGTYTISPTIEDGSAPGDCDLRVTWNMSTSGSIWVGYPGDSPVIDFESTAFGDAEPCIRMSSANIWIDNLEIKNIGSIGFQFLVRTSGYGAVIRRVYGHDLNNGGNGKNSAFFEWRRCDDCPTYYDTVQNSTFANVNSVACALKLYGVQWGIFETSAYSNHNQTNEGMIALKGTLPHYTVRGNTFASDVKTAIGGNMATADPCTGTCAATGGEIYHNLTLGSSYTGNGEGGLTLVYAKIEHSTLSQATVAVYRNTFVGNVVHAWSDSADGPYTLYDNVILNATAASGSCPQYITCYSVTDYSRMVDNGDNVKGANDGTIASATTGMLTGTYRDTYLGVAGYELTANTSTTPPGSLVLLRRYVSWLAPVASWFFHAMEFVYGLVAVFRYRTKVIQGAIAAGIAAKRIYWTVRYRRAVKRWQEAAPVMLEDLRTVTLQQQGGIDSVEGVHGLHRSRSLR